MILVFIPVQFCKYNNKAAGVVPAVTISVILQWFDCAMIVNSVTISDFNPDEAALKEVLLPRFITTRVCSH